MRGRVKTALDKLSSEMNVYVISTTDQCYKVAANLHMRQDNHAALVVLWAVSALRIVSKLPLKHGSTSSPSIKVKIGIHTGSATTSIIGLAVSRFCVFGDAINVAAQLERSAESTSIQTSGETYLQATKQEVVLKDSFLKRIGSQYIFAKGWCIDTFWVQYNEISIRESRSSGNTSLSGNISKGDSRGDPNSSGKSMRIKHHTASIPEDDSKSP
jgi:hypothetical protein